MKASRIGLMRAGRPGLALAGLAALLWLVPFAWMAVASLRPDVSGTLDLASLFPHGPFGWSNYVNAWTSGRFPLWYLNTILLCGGLLAVQAVTVSLAGYSLRTVEIQGTRNRLHVVPAAASAAAGRVGGAEPVDDHATWAVRQPRRHRRPIPRLGVRRVPDAPDLPRHPARLRERRRRRRRHWAASDLAHPHSARPPWPCGLHGGVDHLADGIVAHTVYVENFAGPFPFLADPDYPGRP